MLSISLKVSHRPKCKIFITLLVVSESINNQSVTSMLAPGPRFGGHVTKKLWPWYMIENCIPGGGTQRNGNAEAEGEGNVNGVQMLSIGADIYI